MWNEIVEFATHGGYNDCQKAAAILLREMEADYATRADAGSLLPIIERARTFLSRMGSLARFANQNNRRKFMDAWYDYSAATGLAAA